MSAITSSSAISSAVSSETGSSTLDRDAFMLLLVTQFQYQDPLNPMEDKEFIAQLAQFSSLEQMMNMNESMQSLTAATQSQELVNATSYIGKTVDVSGDTISKQTDAEGNVTISGAHIALGEATVGGIMEVWDLSTGRPVKTIELPAMTAGTHTFNDWDGTITGGELAADGVYRLIPTYVLANGNTLLDHTMVVDGLVTGVINNDGIAHLSLSDGRTTPLAGVHRVSVPSMNIVTPEVDTDGDTDTGDSTTEENPSGTDTGTSGDTSTDSTTGTDTGNTGSGTDTGSGSTGDSATDGNTADSGTTTTP